MERVAEVSQHVAPKMLGLAAELAEVAQLFRQGLLTSEEFAVAKHHLLKLEAPPSTAAQAEPAGASAVHDVSAEADPIVAVPGGINRKSDYEPDDPWLPVVHDNFKDPSLWDGLQTRSGMAGDLVVAALQKEIRRGGENSENALKLAYELQTTSAGAEDKLWQRILIIAAEDVGAVSDISDDAA